VRRAWLPLLARRAECTAARRPQVSDSLLHAASSPLEVQLFCAQTLRVKVERDFEELPPGVQRARRDARARAPL
jgi:hypothetical protein